MPQKPHAVFLEEEHEEEYIFLHIFHSRQI